MISMRKLRVLLVQLPVPNNPSTNIPLAAGYLAAYARAAGVPDSVTIEILPRALADHAGDAALVDAIAAAAPDLLGLSLYTWNSERSLSIAARLKQWLPDLLVVGGGPEVQLDNEWLLTHPALDLAALGEGERTFSDLLMLLAALPDMAALAEHLDAINGLAFRRADGSLHVTPERTALPDLQAVPSPYLLGLLEVQPDDMLMVEVSRWCPYGCSFCLYGRNMGPRLGNRYFPLERLLAEIRWGYERGVRRIHFIEANLNLVPPFQPLMRALADLNADRSLDFYAELRGEHLDDAAVGLLSQAGLRVAEVGLQTANPIALRAAHRKTDLQRWAAGTRRLAAQGIEVLLDVILGLPADDATGVAQTLDFIARERLGGFDTFMLQLLPGTAVRREAAQYALRYQDRPPYYVLATDRLSYAELRGLRAELKRTAGVDADAVEGAPLPRWDALAPPSATPPLVQHLDLRLPSGALPSPRQLAAHVGLIIDTATLLDDDSPTHLWLHDAMRQNPSMLLDLYLVGEPPAPAWLREWRASLPYTPSYLDRVALYRLEDPAQGHARVSPRVWLVVPWVAQVDPACYDGVAGVIWEYLLAEGEHAPLSAWERAGGAGIWVRGAAPSTVASLRAQTDLWLWGDAQDAP